MRCDDCGKKINKTIVERAKYGIATYFNCEKCFNSKYLNDNGIREGEQSVLTVLILVAYLLNYER